MEEQIQEGGYPPPHLGPTQMPGLLTCAVLSLFCLLVAPASHAEDVADQSAAFVTAARQRVAEATRESLTWSGPETGPPALRGKNIALVTEDLRNGGIIGVALGAREAAAVIGWNLKIFDGGGSSATRTKALADALADNPDGLILCGSDALENSPALAVFSRHGIPVIGWHAGAHPGPIADTPVAMNVTTEPIEVARLAAMAAVAQSNGHAGVVILTDSRYSIATAKSRAMEAVIRACTGCTLLEVRDVAISDSAEQMPKVTRELLLRYGRRWTHTLAINDIYFDDSVATLTSAGVPGDGLNLMSAGDGSASAFLRIQARTYQTATVAEPLNLQGWQVIDEMNRVLAGQAVSGFVAPLHLVDAENIAPDVREKFQYDPNNGYRDVYRRLWRPGS